MLKFCIIAVSRDTYINVLKPNNEFYKPNYYNYICSVVIASL